MITVFILVTIGLLVAYYFLYGKRLERNVVKPTDQPTPAVRMRDGVDYVEAPRTVLFGHHFASIAGLGPIGGPALAMVWGWLPGLLWIWWANLFVGLAHDYLALMSSVRYDGRSTQWVMSRLTSGRITYPFQIFLYLLFVTAASGFLAISISMWRAIPGAGTLVLALIFVAAITGYLMYKSNLGFRNGTIVGLILLAGALVLAYYVPTKLSVGWWWVLMFAYMVLASRLPVWVLLQPRDYLMFYVLIAGFALGSAALIVGFRGLELPAFSMWSARAVGGQPSSFLPMVTLVIMCGALSGGHALLASGTTSKQLSKEAHGLFIGGGAMMTEGFLASVVVLTMAGYGYTVLTNAADKLAKAGVNLAQLTTDPVAHGNLFAKAMGQTGGPVGTFASSFGVALNDGLGLPVTLATLFAAIWVTGFALTTADTAIRVSRFFWQEALAPLERVSQPLHRVVCDPWVASIIPAGIAAWLGYKAGWAILWPAVAGMNQFAASLGLLTGSLWALHVLKARKLYVGFLMAPGIFLWLMVTTAMGWFVLRVPTNNWVKAIIAYGFVLSLFMMVEWLLRLRKGPAPEAMPAPAPQPARRS